jgi:hypothetical protein
LQRISDPAPNFNFFEGEEDDEGRKEFIGPVNTENPIATRVLQKDEVEKISFPA